MASGFGFPMLSPAEIVEALVQFNIAPVANLRPEDIAKPHPDLLPAILSRFLASFVDAPGANEDGQLGFSDLVALDNPEHHAEAIRVLRLHNKSRAFLESIQFKDFTLADLLRPTPRRVVEVLSALLNFLFYREEKLNLLNPIVNESPDYHERTLELKLQKEIADHELAKQMEEPMAQQLEADLNALQQKVQVYNKQQKALRAKSTDISDKKEEIDRKITQADFELTKHAQENSKLRSKLVKSPEKVQRALEEKKSVRAKLKESEKTAMQNVQEKTATLEILNKANEKLAKQHTKIQDVQEKLAAAKTVEKEVKARKAKLNDESRSVMSFDAQIVEWQGKVHEMEERLKAKVKETDQIIADENQKLGALKSEIECKLQCLEPREKKVEAMIAKVRWRQEEAGKTVAIAHVTSERDSIEISPSVGSDYIQIFVKFGDFKIAVDAVLQNTVREVVSIASADMGVVIKDYYIVYSAKYLQLDDDLLSQDILFGSFLSPRCCLRGGVLQWITLKQPLIEYTHYFGDELFDLCNIPRFGISVCLAKAGTTICSGIVAMIRRLFEKGYCAPNFSSSDILFNHNTGSFVFRSDFDGFKSITMKRFASSMSCLSWIIRRIFYFAPAKVQCGEPVIRILAHGDDKDIVIGQLPDFIAYMVTDLLDVTNIVVGASEEEIMDCFTVHIASKTSLARICWEIVVCLHMFNYPGSFEQFAMFMEQFGTSWLVDMDVDPLNRVAGFRELTYDSESLPTLFCRHIRNFLSHPEIHRMSEKQAEALVMLKSSHLLYLVARDMSLRIPMRIRNGETPAPAVLAR